MKMLQPWKEKKTNHRIKFQSTTLFVDKQVSKNVILVIKKIQVKYIMNNMKNQMAPTMLKIWK